MSHQELVQKFKEVLARYVPPGAEMMPAEWLVAHKAHLAITRPRNRRLGTYMPPRPQKGKGHRITINGNLSSYQFLITLVHEMAHLLVWERYHKNGRRVQPHGKEWKAAFQELMQPFLQPAYFPPDVLAPLRQMMQNPPSATMRHRALWEALACYSKPVSGRSSLPSGGRENEEPNASTSPAALPAHLKRLRDVPEQMPFVLYTSGGARRRTFQKVKLLRSYYLCKEVSTGNLFRIHEQALVEAVG